MLEGKKYISIFCGSRNGNNPKLLSLAYEFGMYISNNYGLVYGGTNIGLMNAFAEGVLKGNGNIIGVITEQFINAGIMHEGVSNMIISADMHKRKADIYNIADIYVVFPGGLGTLDELFELLTWKSLNILNKPVLLFNYDGYFNNLLLFLEHVKLTGFIDPELNKLFVVCERYEDLKHMLEIK